MTTTPFAANLKTITGKTYDEVRELLDRPLPPSAYKQIPGAGSLTDIDSDWQNRVFNTVFGLCGLGWGYSFSSADMDVREEIKQNNKPAAFAVLKHLVMWIVLVENNGNRVRLEIASCGANRSEFGNVGYAMKGAITSALGAAASKIGWQESVYLGIRTHADTDARAQVPPKVGTAPETTTTPPPAQQQAAPEAPAAPAATAATAPAQSPLRFFKCQCGANLTERERPDTCKACGISGATLKEYPTLAALNKAAAPIPEAPPQPAEHNPPPGGYGAILHPCMSCGTEVFDDISLNGMCSHCGKPTVDGNTKVLHSESQFLCGKNRAVWLRRAGEVVGREVKQYADMSADELVRFIRVLRREPRPVGNTAASAAPAAAATAPAPTAAAPAAGPAASAPAAGGAAGGNGSVAGQAGAGTGRADVETMSKVNLVRYLFEVAVRADPKLNSANAILANMSQRWGRTITSSTEMTPDELKQSVREFEAVAGGK